MILVLCFSLFIEVESTAEAITPGGGGVSRDGSLKDSTPITAGGGSTVEIPAAQVVLPTVNVGDETIDVNLTASKVAYMPPIDDQSDPAFERVEPDAVTTTSIEEVVVCASTSVKSAAATSENLASELLVDTSNYDDQDDPVDMSVENPTNTTVEVSGNYLSITFSSWFASYVIFAFA